MINRTEEINRIIKEKGYTSYLEIGLGNGVNFRSIEVETKIGVDPDSIIDKAGVFKMTSDEWFTDSDKFDLIFIDGLHHADQVQRDILNAWRCLNRDGMIIIHDVKPLDEKSQRVPREQTAWTGDVWRAWYGLKKTYPKLRLDYIDERVGMAIINKSKHKISEGFVDNETSYEEYNSKKGWEV